MKKTFPAFAVFLVVGLCSAARAGVVATDGDVPPLMVANGTAGDPAEYLIGFVPGYAADLDYVVLTNSDNSLVIQSGGTLTSGLVSIGEDVGSNHNAATVSGTGSLWNVTAQLYLGYYGVNDTLRIEAGGQMTTSGSINFGSGSTSNSTLGSNNGLVVTGIGSTLIANGPDFLVGGYGSNNSVLIADGGRMQTNNGDLGDGSATNAALGAGNSITVTGGGSTWVNAGDLEIGNNGSGNRVTVTDQALVELDAGALSFGLSATAGTNALQVGNGYFAWSGDHVLDLNSFVESGNVSYWNGSIFVTATTADLTNGNLYATYFTTGLTASAATDGLYTFTGDYTILTTIPEPSIHGISLVALLGGAILLRRRRPAVA